MNTPSKSKLFLSTLGVTALLFSAPASADNCNQWDYFRTNGQVEGMDLKAMAAAAKRATKTTKQCYGTDRLTVEMSAGPVDFEGLSGTFNIVSQDRAGNGISTYSIGGRTYKTRVTGALVEIQKPDGSWKNIDDLKAISRPLEALGPNPTMGEFAIGSIESKIESDRHLAPIAEGLMVVGIGGLMSTLAVPYFSNFAPLAEKEGTTETVGGYSTDVWHITAERAQQYAASKGAVINASGSSIKYWVSPGGLIIKIEAKLGSGITEGPPAKYTYKVSKTAAP